ncbi:MAG TPA: hypothetical protein VGO18_06180 [Steroidobacteraceae bacterium]|jgi:hypothetical protein|nr:hypothetical protein [Steroidobacteraceae bacterium]
MRNLLYLASALLALQTLPAHAERELPPAEHDRWSGAPIKPDKNRNTPSPITDRFYVRGTFFNPAITTTLRIDTQSPGPGLAGTLGTPVSGEKDLGLDSRNPQGRIEIMFRLRERNRLRVDYFESNRRGDHVINRQILFGNETFAVNDRVTSSVQWRQFGLTYTFSVLRTDRFELGLGLAVHFVEAEARGQVVAKRLRQDVSGAGAFPTIPLDFTWRISRRFAMVARAQYLRASVNNFEGSMGDYHADFQYRWKPNFSVGAGYTDMRSFLQVNDAHFPGLFRQHVRGPEAFFKVSF